MIKEMFVQKKEWIANVNSFHERISVYFGWWKVFEVNAPFINNFDASKNVI